MLTKETLVLYSDMYVTSNHSLCGKTELAVYSYSKKKNQSKQNLSLCFEKNKLGEVSFLMGNLNSLLLFLSAINFFKDKIFIF